MVSLIFVFTTMVSGQREARPLDLLCICNTGVHRRVNRQHVPDGEDRLWKGRWSVLISTCISLLTTRRLDSRNR